MRRSFQHLVALVEEAGSLNPQVTLGELSKHFDEPIERIEDALDCSKMLRREPVTLAEAVHKAFNLGPDEMFGAKCQIDGCTRQPKPFATITVRINDSVKTINICGYHQGFFQQFPSDLYEIASSEDGEIWLRNIPAEES